MIKLLIFTLTTYGITNIMIFGSIFEPFRNLMLKSSFLGKLFTCFICLSFWVGATVSYLLISPTEISGLGASLHILDYNIPKEYLRLFFDACLASGSVWLIHTTQEYLEK